MKGNRGWSNGCIVLLLAWLLLFTGCSNGEGKRADEMSMSQNSAVTEDIALSTKEKQAEREQAEETPSVSANRKLIKNVQLRLETTEFDVSVQRIEAVVAQFGGYVEGSNVTGTSVQEHSKSLRSAVYTIRIPASKLDEYVSEAGSMGNIVSKQIGTEDVTEQYVDTEARIKTLQAREERLLELLQQAGTVKDVIEIEKELSVVRYEIESFTAALKRYDSLVDYSTVQIEVIEIKSLTQNASKLGERIGEAFMKSVTGIVNGAQLLLVFVVGNSPAFLLLGAIATAVVWLVRRARKGKNGDV